jgi:hypothetical protein
MFPTMGGQMKAILRWTAAIYLCCASTVAFAGKLPGGTGLKFLVGYNEAWFGPNYGNSIASNPSVFCLPSSFDPIFVEKMFVGMQVGGAKIVRIWVFPALQGIQLSPAACPIGAQTPQTMGLTPDLIPQDPTVVGNLERVFLLARKHHLMVYVTALNGNDMQVAATNITGLRPYFQNLLNPFNTDGELDRFKKNALLPLLKLMNKYKDSKLPVPDSNLPVIYGFDLISEIEAPLNAGYFSNFSLNPVRVAQDWIKNITLFVHQYSPSLPVTTSAGGSFAAFEIAVGLFSGLGLDFYDLHAYADLGLYPGLTAPCNSNPPRVPIILGEYGQKSHTFSANLQFLTTFNFLTTAKTHCFSAALAWKYDTRCDRTIAGCPSPGFDWWTYLIPGPGPFAGTFRPAYFLIH